MAFSVKAFITIYVVKVYLWKSFNPYGNLLSLYPLRHLDTFSNASRMFPSSLLMPLCFVLCPLDEKHSLGSQTRALFSSISPLSSNALFHS